MPRDDSAPGTRDSAGIRIVENTRPAWSAQDAPLLAASPVLVIGDRSEPRYLLGRVAGAARLSDGRIVVADGGSLQLRFFDGGGEFIESVGGRGEGPGEFRRLDRFGVLAGDTTFAQSGPGTVTFSDPQGTFLRRVNVFTPEAGPDGLEFIVALLGDQSIVVAPVPQPSPRAAGTRWVYSIPLEIVGRDTTERVRLGTFPYMLIAMDEGDPRPPWFGATMVAASGASSLFVGYGGEYSIRVLSSNGDLQRIIRRSWTPTRVTPEDIDVYVTEWAKRWIRATGPETERQKRDLRDDPYASEVPAYSQFIVDRTGRLWVREAHLADAPGSGDFSAMPLVPSVWSVFDDGGSWLGDVTMPARFMPTDIGADYVLGIARDSDGVETVVQYAYGN